MGRHWVPRLLHDNLYLASGGIINWNAGDITIHIPRTCWPMLGPLGYTFDAAVLPSTNDAAALGASGTASGDCFSRLAVSSTGTLATSPSRMCCRRTGWIMPVRRRATRSTQRSFRSQRYRGAGRVWAAWADLYMASGSVINWSASDLALTHSSDTLTLAGGNLTLAGGNLTLSGALSGTTGTFSGTVSGASGSFSADLTDAGSFSAGISAKTGTFSSAITATTGSFSGAAAASSLTTSGNIRSTGGDVYASSILGVAGTTGNCHLWRYRPTARTRGHLHRRRLIRCFEFSRQRRRDLTLDSGGSLYVPGALTAISTITTNQPIFANGYRCKTGIYGGYGGNTYNWYWGNGYLDVYIDATPFRIITPSDYGLKKDVADLPSTWAKVKALSRQLPAFRLRNADWC